MIGVEDTVVARGVGDVRLEEGDGIEDGGKDFAGISEAELVEEARGRRELVEILGEFGADLEDEVGDGFTGEAVFFHLFLDERLKEGIRVEVGASCRLPVASCRLVEGAVGVVAVDSDEPCQDGGGLEGRMELDAEGRGSTGAATFAGLRIGTFGESAAASLARLHAGRFGLGGFRFVEVFGVLGVLGIYGVLGFILVIGVFRVWGVADGAGDGFDEMADAFLLCHFDAEVTGFIEEFGRVGAHVRDKGSDDLIRGDA